MSAPNKLEIKGKLVRSPLPELIAEIEQIGLSGSLRLSRDEHKVILYFDKGKFVFAVSNSRRHRLYEILIEQGQLTREEISGIENFTNDLYLSRHLVQEGRFTKENAALFFDYQIKEILREALGWETGEWMFSSLARVKEQIRFDVRIGELLYRHAASLGKQQILARFKSYTEKFGAHPDRPSLEVEMEPAEAFLLSRLEGEPLSIEELRSMCGLPGDEVMQILYRLWVGGVLHRYGWNSAFNVNDVAKMNAARLTLVRSAISVEQEQKQRAEEKAREEKRKKAEEAARRKAEEAERKEREKREAFLNMPLEQYLEMIEQAATHYEIFGVEQDADVADIKTVYFAFAKKFHPDLYHKQVEPELHDRIQHAFTELAKAYDTLRDEESREVYDFKLRKVLEALKRGEAPRPKEKDGAPDRATMAAESFDKGHELMSEERYFEALPHLGRAVHLDGRNAEYHAFYGRALSFDRKQGHKAEAELQTAVRLDPDNTSYRFMLAELFVDLGLQARARGELQRLLEIAPGDHDARSLLDSLG